MRSRLSPTEIEQLYDQYIFYIISTRRLKYLKKEGRIQEKKSQVLMQYELNQRIEELSLNESVIMTGHRRDVPEILAALDIALFTSIWEGTPIGIVEAMLMGKAIVATKVGGIPELIENGVTGILVKPYDKEAMAKAVTLLINDKKLARTISEMARRRAKGRFGLKTMVSNMTKLYDDFIASKIIQ